MRRHCADARFVWNLALEQTNLYRSTFGPTPNHTVRNRQLAEARKDTWLGKGSSVVQQAALRDFDKAMSMWWAGSHGRPTWRKKHLHNGFAVRDLVVVKLNRHWATVNVPKCGPVKFRLSRPIPTEAKSARVTLDRSGRWHVSLVAGQPTFEREATGQTAGVDLGVVETVALSTGELFRIPALSAGKQARRKRLQRKLARQQKGSNRRGKTRQTIAKLAAYETDMRNDWVEKMTTDLVRRFDHITFENLPISKMVRSAAGTVENPGVNVAQKRGLNRAIHAQCWGKIRQRTEQKAAASTTAESVRVPPKNTSRRCSVCGLVAKANRTTQARFVCVGCGHTENADINAGKNINAAGLAVSGRGATEICGDETSTISELVAV